MSPLLVEVTRRDERSGQALVESCHRGDVAVVGPDGEVVAALGDPGLMILARSAVKPFQAAASREVLGADAGLLTSEELAVACASHRAEPRHLAAVDRLLDRAGLGADQLTCPADAGLHDPGATPERRRHNCSGKHALFALAGARLGLTGKDVLVAGGPLQTRVLARLAAELGPAGAVAIDGCGAPAVAVPLSRLAAAYAHLVRSERFAPVRAAMLDHPGLVGGEGRAESALLAAGVVAKPGAEGVMAAGWRGDGGTYGLALKVADGAYRAAATAAVGLLEAAGVVPAGTWSAPPPTGGDVPVGEVRISAEVRAVARRLAPM